MIVELFLITELLRNTVGTPISTSEAPSPTPTPTPTPVPTVPTGGVTPTPDSGAGLITGIFEVGPITDIGQSFIFTGMTPEEASNAYLDAIEGIEITSLPFTGKR